MASGPAPVPETADPSQLVATPYAAPEVAPDPGMAELVLGTDPGLTTPPTEPKSP
jgi:hypothetical protein